ncbi:hypothetical protein ACQKGO_07070 [Corallococcus interemptor]|uniref:hypothetical protein n=1 Tax=Corallococcus interemptor TaxID=2316720 RepID=UPI003CFEC9B1
MKGALELLVEAMGAQSAAAAGLASEQLERYATSMSPSSFPGKIAAGSDETCSVLDAGATPFELSPQLRQKVRESSPREKTRLLSLGHQLSVHLDNAKLYAELRED